jgi:hypothetical protein
LTSLPPLPPTLIRLNCLGNPLETLPELPSTLLELKCELPMFDDAIVLIGMQPDLVDHTNRLIRNATITWAQLSRDRCTTRCAIYKEEIMMKAWHPSRVERLIEMGYDMEDM